MADLWVEKYRPKTLSEYLCKDHKQRLLFEKWAKEGLPHVLLEGRPGTGKTSLAYVLMNELGVQQSDILFVNASSERKVDDLDKKITDFAAMYPLGEYRYIILDECDSLTPLMQRVLRNTMEKYADVSRFILTCNEPERLIEAIHSRCQRIHFDEMDVAEFQIRIGEILVNENITFDIETLDHYVDITYPDLRKCIGLVQLNSVDGTLSIPTEPVTGSLDFTKTIIDQTRRGKVTDARKLLIEYASVEEYEDIYRWVYHNLDQFTTDNDKQNEIILLVARYIRNHHSLPLADAEINLVACFIEIAQTLG